MEITGHMLVISKEMICLMFELHQNNVVENVIALLDVLILLGPNGMVVLVG
jgi:hypothetical protein